jgi:peroxiredoxin Q/BCP
LRTTATTITAMATGLARVIGRSVVRLVRRDGSTPGVELKPGDLAPDFVLEGSDGCTYALSQFIGRQAVVLAWFPKAFTGGCTAECESIDLISGALRQFKVAPFGACVDNLETVRRFAASMDIDFPILSDPKKTAARAYGVLGLSGFPARRTFFIGMDGRIVAIDTDVRTSTHGPDIVAAVTRLQVPKPA